jgi:DNA replication protein DnaC
MARPDCPQCQGSGWKVVERSTQGARPLSSDRPGAAAQGEPKLVWAVPCDCTAEDRVGRALARARVPDRYRHCDFDNFETDNEIEGVSAEQLKAWSRSLSQARLIVKRFAEEFIPLRGEDGEPGLLLMGACGVGKTHLAVAALKEIVRRGHSGIFYDYRELLKEIQDSYNASTQATEMTVLEPVLTAEFLVLDDLGSSKPSEWVRETVGHILNNRYNENRVTLITTNYRDSEEPAGASATSASRPNSIRGGALEESLSERIGRRIRSRLYEMCRTIEIAAPDYRKEIRHATRRA